GRRRNVPIVQSRRRARRAPQRGQLAPRRWRSRGINHLPARSRATRRALLFLARDLLADLLERAADQPRDVHLRDPDLLRDLRLRQPLEEAQVQDCALALVEDAKTRGEDGAVFRDLVFVLLRAERLERVEVAVVVLTR